MKTAFYPCCADDIEEPRTLLTKYADEIIFCDRNPKLLRWHKSVEGGPIGLPIATFLVGNVLEVVRKLPSISVLFYRRDSEGEGGSGVFILGDSVLPLILKRFPAEGGLIITDGSNSRRNNFRKMIRQNGLRKYGWNFTKVAGQPLEGFHGLTIVSVTRADNPTDDPRDVAM